MILITGATSGIGKAMAKASAQQGEKVFFCGRCTELGQQVEAEIRTLGGEATYLQADFPTLPTGITPKPQRAHQSTG